MEAERAEAAGGRARQLGQRVLELTPALMHELRRLLRAAAPADLSLGQFRILAQLRRGIDQPQKLAGHHGVSQPAMSQMIDVLVQKGWVERRRAPQDRRQIRLGLSRKGRRLVDQARAQSVAQLAQRFAACPAQELETLQESLERLAQVLAHDAQPRKKD